MSVLAQRGAIASLLAWGSVVACAGPTPPLSEPPRPTPAPKEPLAVPPLPSAAPPASRGSSNDVYCSMSLADPCSCRSLEKLTTMTDGYDAKELDFAARELAAALPSRLDREVVSAKGPTCAGCPAPTRTVVRAPATVTDVTCLSIAGGKLYCRAAVDAVSPGPLPMALEMPPSCTTIDGRERCATLKFDVVRACPREGGATVWAEGAGLSELWRPTAGANVRGGTR